MDTRRDSRVGVFRSMEGDCAEGPLDCLVTSNIFMPARQRDCISNMRSNNSNDDVCSNTSIDASLERMASSCTSNRRHDSHQTDTALMFQSK